MEKVLFFNGFGIKPTNTYVSAGSDFYIPNINDGDPCAKVALHAFEKSYGKDMLQIMDIFNTFGELLPTEKFNNNAANLIHLYLSLQDYDLEEKQAISVEEGIKYFIENFLVFSDKGTPGIKLRCNNHLFFNSGIKVGLNPNECGLYVNKSGMGNKGLDVRACLVDEDYAGYVHLSCAYTKHTHKDMVVYCGDKLTQMMLFNVNHGDWTETTEEEYNKYMENSERKDKGFGSSDVKH